MFIIDLNQVMLSNLLMQVGFNKTSTIEEDMVRHMILNSLRSYRVKFAAEYGQMIIACDNTNCWRKQFFPYYKANRKKNKENSNLDWNAIFQCLNKIREELKEFFPYIVIDIETAEADDIIATIISELGSELGGEPLLIVSGDKDFVQLHRFANVKQYDPTRKKWITNNSPENFLKEHIIKGDAGDGIPNILSNDNCFVLGERQRTVSGKKLNEIMNMSEESILRSSIARNYSRNKTLIDLTSIPDELKQKILNSYHQQKNNPKNRTNLMNYFIVKKLKLLMENINEF